MRHRDILFSDEMMRAILVGQKTVTRRTGERPKEIADD